MYDLIIIGSGPAGLSAAIYAARAKLDFVVIESAYISGGQILSTYEIDNYPGLPGISGQELADKMRAHADALGAQFIIDRIDSISGTLGHFVLKSSTKEYEAKTVIITTGAEHAKLGVEGEDAFQGKGVSYCATCDGMFFRKKDVVVVGGGDTALSDAIYLSRICNSVTLIHRRDELRGAKSLQDKYFSADNAKVEWSSELASINGDKMVSSVTIRNKVTGELKELPVRGVFIAVGIKPNSSYFEGFVETDDRGYIIAGENGATSVEGIFAAGDVRKKALRQIITAAADGANAVDSVQEVLTKL